MFLLQMGGFEGGSRGPFDALNCFMVHGEENLTFTALAIGVEVGGVRKLQMNECTLNCESVDFATLTSFQFCGSRAHEMLNSRKQATLARSEYQVR